MCKKVLDILFPTNILGKGKRSFKIDLPSGYTSVHLSITWSGERLIACYTRYWIPPRTQGKYESIKNVFTNGHSDNETVSVARINNIHQRIGCDTVYFNCTNVTELIINGVRYI